MKKTLFILLVLVFNLSFSQNEYVNQVLILNEGSLDFYSDEIIEPVTVGVYSISSPSPSYFEVIQIEGAKFASDLIIDESFFYVAADNRVLKYDLDSYELIVSQEISGARKLAIHNEYLFVSKGDYDSENFGPVIFDSYLDVYDLDLNYQFSFDSQNGPQWSTESMLIKDDVLYVLINNAYEWGNYQGIIGKINLNTMNYDSELDLGEDGKNPINLMLKDEKLYTLNNKNWDGSSISVIDLNTSGIQTINLSDVSAGCGVSIIRENRLNYQKSGDLEMGIFDLELLAQTGVEDNLNLNYYSIAENPVSGNIFLATADFVNNSQVYIYDSNNNEISNFTSGVTTNKIVFDTRIESVKVSEINHESDNKLIKVVDLAGREVIDDNFILNIYEDGVIDKKYILK